MQGLLSIPNNIEKRRRRGSDVFLVLTGGYDEAYN